MMFARGENAWRTASCISAWPRRRAFSSSLTVVLAHVATARKEYAKAQRLIYLTVFFGLIFMVVKGYEYTHEIQHGFTPVTNLFWSFYFLMTGLHALHVLIGMVAMVIVAIKIRQIPQTVEYVGMYWHFVDIVWIFLFPLLYLAS